MVEADSLGRLEKSLAAAIERLSPAVSEMASEDGDEEEEGSMRVPIRPPALPRRKPVHPKKWVYPWARANATARARALAVQARCCVCVCACRAGKVLRMCVCSCVRVPCRPAVQRVSIPTLPPQLDPFQTRQHPRRFGRGRGESPEGNPPGGERGLTNPRCAIDTTPRRFGERCRALQGSRGRTPRRFVHPLWWRRWTLARHVGEPPLLAQLRG